MLTVIMIQSAVLLLFAVLLVLWLLKKLSQSQEQWTVLSRQLASSQQQSALAQSETEEFRSGIIGVGQRVLTLEARLKQLQQEMQELQQQQQVIALSDPESKMYSRAMKMVQLGAGLDEIMQECELPRAEAELLLSLHQQRQ
ncbi:DUF2802 domain-containing protein [Arsukibacterium sp.]|uniref:DUF2802 domain-containing protein n=1 Tax=Arsukibacterium sp. TaxID=1977258 RepID=UPI002FDAC8F7